MGFGESGKYVPGPCPGCGKPESAVMGWSEWGHDLSCCGDKCGRKVGATLKAMRRDQSFLFFEEMERHAKDQQWKLRCEYLALLRAKTEQEQERKKE